MKRVESNDVYPGNYRNTGAEFILGTGRFLASLLNAEVELVSNSRCYSVLLWMCNGG